MFNPPGVICSDRIWKFSADRGVDFIIALRGLVILLRTVTAEFL